MLLEQRISWGISAAECAQPEEAGDTVAVGFAGVGHNTGGREIVLQIKTGNLE